MSSLIILFIVAITIAVLILQGSLVRGVMSVILAILAVVIAFSFFESLANLLISRDKIIGWAQPIAFGVLFLLSFAILQAVGAIVLKHKINFGDLPEKIGRGVSGLFLGLILAGVLLTLLAMAPLPPKYPYERFDASSPDPTSPKKALPNADGLVTGLFSLISKGSMSGKQSFATLHPDFSNQLYLNRIGGSGVPLVSTKEAIGVLKKDGVWQTREGLTDTESEPVSPKSGHTLMTVRIRIGKSSLQQAGSFTLGQIRLICKDRSVVQDTLAGSGLNLYPLGYMASESTITTPRLSDVIKVVRENFAENENDCFIDFVFNVPNGYVPVLLQFKGNNALTLSAVASGDQVPTPIGFQQIVAKKTDEKESGNSRNRPNSRDNRRPSSSNGSGSSGSKVLDHIAPGVGDQDLQDVGR